MAAIFHETNTAETKGSGIRTMRRLMRESGFSLPTFESNRAENFFFNRLLLHHFLSEDDLVWLKQAPEALSDGQKTALIFVREQGAVDNQTLRQLTGGEVLAVSQELRRLRDTGLLAAKGKGSATYYVPGAAFPVAGHTSLPAEHTSLPPGHTSLASEHGTLADELGTLADEHGTLADEMPLFLREKIEKLGKRRGEEIRPMILELCAWRSLTAGELVEIFGRSDSKALRRDHLGDMIATKQLEYTHPDMERHPKQAYRTANPQTTP